LPEALAAVVATVVLPLMTVTVAPASGCDEAQVWSAQANTVPLIVKPVTVRVTVTDCVFPTTEPVLSVATMVMVPVYVPESRFTAEAFTPNKLPVPLSVPEAAVSASHWLLVDACQVTGRPQVPLSLSTTLSADEVVCPCANEMARLAGEGVNSRHGGKIVSVTVKVCVLPCTAIPFASLAEMVTTVLYVPATRPVMFALTPTLPDCPGPPMIPRDAVCVNQLPEGATEVFHESGHIQLPVPVNRTVCVAGLAVAPCTALKERALDDGGDSVQGGCITRFTTIVCGLPGAVLPFASIPLSVICPT